MKFWMNTRTGQLIKKRGLGFVAVPAGVLSARQIEAMQINPRDRTTEGGKFFQTFRPRRRGSYQAKKTGKKVHENQRNGTRRMEEIDLTLSVLCACIKPERPMTQQEIADCCGCTHQLISNIERKAISKIRPAIEEILKHDGLSLADFSS